MTWYKNCNIQVIKIMNMDKMPGSIREKHETWSMRVLVLHTLHMVRCYVWNQNVRNFEEINLLIVKYLKTGQLTVCWPMSSCILRIGDEGHLVLKRIGVCHWKHSRRILNVALNSQNGNLNEKDLCSPKPTYFYKYNLLYFLNVSLNSETMSNARWNDVSAH